MLVQYNFNLRSSYQQRETKLSCDDRNVDSGCHGDKITAVVVEEKEKVRL